MRFFPIFLDPAAGEVILVGGGEAAEAKLRLLESAGAKVRWYAAPSPDHHSSRDNVQRFACAPGQADFENAIAAISAAGDPLDGQVYDWARARNIPVNVVDRPELCTFITPAIVDRGEVVVAVGTSGSAPVLARRIREQIEALLPARIGELAQLIGHWRGRVAKRLRSIRDRRRFWEKVIDGAAAQSAIAGKIIEADAAIAKLVEETKDSAALRGGFVHIVGAGPGDPELLTIKAVRAMQDADIVFYDELVTLEILERVRRDAERVFVGKKRGDHGIGQDEINRRIVAAARAGQRVVRLKGGDPYVFGRGGEEVEVLRDASVAYAVVPGITSAIGCAAEAELPLTFRNEATRVAIVTAHRAGEAETDWTGFADPLTTIVAYMGLSGAAKVRDGLIAAGRDPSTPAAVIARGTRKDSNIVVGRLDALAALAAQAGSGPALLVVGQTVRRSAKWLSELAKEHAA
jgi:uroporphyrin-III C-methyltransferase/precorrin-2 dehydrogenase/sirohydrochlorin ferrochelatase